MSNAYGHIHTCPHCGGKVDEGYGKFSESGSPSVRRIAARILARHLLLSMNIRQGTELVPLIGETGREKDNLEALTSWVYGRVAHLEKWPIPSTQVVSLASSLEQQLKDTIWHAEMAQR